MSNCPFCKSETKKVELSRLDLRICPHCLGTFFPSDKTMAFRREIYDKTRVLWLQKLEERRADWIEPTENTSCIDHGEKLVDGKLPITASPGKSPLAATCFNCPLRPWRPFSVEWSPLLRMACCFPKSQSTILRSSCSWAKLSIKSSARPPRKKIRLNQCNTK